jgi:hypothetical protein
LCVWGGGVMGLYQGCGYACAVSAAFSARGEGIPGHRHEGAAAPGG